MSISSLVNNCLANFKATQAIIQDNTSLQDEYGRFRVWTGNVSAHRAGRRSLEYRLRDASNLRATVLMLLKDLLQSLNGLHAGLEEAHRNSQEYEAWPLLHTSNESQEHNDVDSEDDALLFGLENDTSTSDQPLERLLSEVHDIVSCLLRFSMALRNPARHDQIRHSAMTMTKHFEPYDIGHVQQKFPSAQTYLHERSGKAISKHRQYLKYREHHHLKLSEGLESDSAEEEEQSSTIATSVNKADASAASPFVTDKDDETESVYTVTSHAPTAAGNISLRPPPRPVAGYEDGLFECPLCYRIIVTENNRAWRQHVYEDLPPYVCMYSECITADRCYSRRRDWQRHQINMHNRYWSCAFCSAEIHSELSFQEHLVGHHGQGPERSILQTLTDACAVSSQEVPDLSCPLCKTTQPSSKRWFKHVGHHLEQLALHALPQHVMGSETEDDEDEHAIEGSDRSAGEVGIIAGSHRESAGRRTEDESDSDIDKPQNIQTSQPLDFPRPPESDLEGTRSSTRACAINAEAIRQANSNFLAEQWPDVQAQTEELAQSIQHKLQAQQDSTKELLERLEARLGSFKCSTETTKEILDRLEAKLGPPKYSREELIERLQARGGPMKELAELLMQLQEQ
ncbi:hypothetical protein LTR37_003474 [Vermiconidia calcicola]|uniref:Uncharacterized protein n=1 Tax=Vermiconidia calcicola TaxID=1690605 RepID=A0ACC3NPI1_9PEZI|nr:hypothetical protein LTR37_003474 [Vermiconidia calcicola]